MSRREGRADHGRGPGPGPVDAVTLAREGAQVVVTDVCEPIPRVAYELATTADLAETARLVEIGDAARRLAAS